MAAQRGGLSHEFTDVYAAVRAAIDHFLARKTSVRIQLAAQPKGSVVQVTADADGSFPAEPPIRLRLVLAEERIFMRAHNGIREHEMVVRAMPGGPQGIEMKGGKLHYQGTIDLKAIRQELNDQLIADEEKQKSKFDSKPLDLSHLRLVAFVQTTSRGKSTRRRWSRFPSPTSAAGGNVPSAKPQRQPTVARDGRKP